MGKGPGATVSGSPGPKAKAKKKSKPTGTRKCKFGANCQDLRKNTPGSCSFEHTEEEKEAARKDIRAKPPPQNVPCFNAFAAKSGMNFGEITMKLKSKSLPDTASKKSAGPDSPQRLAKRYTATQRTMDQIETTRSKIAQVREMIRRFPQEPLDDTPHEVWLQNYSRAPRYDHIDHGPWVGSPKGSSAALFPTSPSGSPSWRRP